MIKEILLVFAVGGEAPQISQRIFDSVEQCAGFVDTLAEQRVVQSDGKFRFIANDGVFFEGQCVDRREYILQRGTLHT